MARISIRSPHEVMFNVFADGQRVGSVGRKNGSWWWQPNLGVQNAGSETRKSAVNALLAAFAITPDQPKPKRPSSVEKD